MKKTITTEEFDKLFDEGADITPYLDMSTARVVRPEATETRMVNITLPKWLVDVLDREAARRAVPRKSVINDWLVDRADAEAARAQGTPVSA